MADAVRIFVGTSANGEDAEAEAVLAWSVKKHCSRPFEIVWMRQSSDPASFWHGWNSETWATPFSCFRMGISAYCGFEGKAIYVDEDVWFESDPAELFDQPFQPGKVVMGKGEGSWRLCVSLWDCAAAKRWLPPIDVLKTDRKALAKATAILRDNNLIQSFEGDWNCLDGKGYAHVSDPRIKALHFTDMRHQCHLPYALKRLEKAGQRHWFDGQVLPHPRADVQARFDELLAECIAAGEGPEKFIPAQPFGAYRKATLVNYKGAPQ